MCLLYCKKPINLICRETLPSIIQGTLNPLRYGTYYLLVQTCSLNHLVLLYTSGSIYKIEPA